MTALPTASGGRAGALAEAIALPLAAIAVSLVLFGIFVAFAGAAPLAMYHQMLRGAFGTWFSIQSSLSRAAPLMLTALCAAIPARLGLIVIGGEGALVLGGLAAAVAATAMASAPPLAVAIGWPRPRWCPARSGSARARRCACCAASTRRSAACS